MEEDILDQIASGKFRPAVAASVVPAPVPQAELASQKAQLIGYALSRHVPAMQRGFEVITSYGPWHVDGELAEQMDELMRQHLMKQLESVEARQ